jgi:hypothetical protein
MSDEGRKEGQEDAAAGKLSAEELKARLGLKPRPREEPAAPAKPKPEDFGLPATQQPVAAPRPAAPETSTITAAEEIPPEVAPAVRKKWIWAGVAAAAVTLLLGLMLGGVMKGRAVENLKTKEARHLLEYFQETRVQTTGQVTAVLQVVEEMRGEVSRLAEVMAKAAESEDPRVRLDAEKELDGFLKRVQAYRDVKPLFDLRQAYPGVVFNGELASEVVAFIQAVQRLYDEAVALALEADTLETLTLPEEKGVTTRRTIFVAPPDAEGIRKAEWIQAVDKENVQNGPNGPSVAVLPVGKDSAFMAPVASLAEIDISPVGREKAALYKGTIYARIRARVAQVKMAADLVRFDPLKEKLQRFANRSGYFTIF